MSTAVKSFFISVILISLQLKNVNSQKSRYAELNDQSANKQINAKILRKAEETSAILQEWKDFDQHVKRYLSDAIKMVLPMMMERFEESYMNVSASCIRDALKIVSGLKASKVWAFSIIDASGKALDGLLGGSLSSLGEYDQCINIKAVNERRGRSYGSILFRGKYCALDMWPPLPPKRPFYRIDEVVEELKNFSETGTIVAEAAKVAHFFHFLTIRIGVCVPSGCSKEDISGMAQKFLQRSRWKSNVKRCEMKKDEVKITPLMKFCFGIFGFFGLLLVTGTIVDLIYSYRLKKVRGTGVRIMTCFSFVSNFRKLTDTSARAETLGFLCGVRVLSITWVILGHTYLIVNYQLFRGLKQIVAYKDDFLFQVVINASLAVDSFFFMSGLLLCYVTMNLVKRMKHKFNIAAYIFHRVWRMLPLYALTVAFVFLTPLLGYGPIWRDTLDPELENCYKNWWTNFLFLNNYLDPEHICLIHSWFVACDMQLYLFSLIILLPLLRWPKVGIFLAVLCGIASIVVSSLITYFNNFPPTMLFVLPDPVQRAHFLPQSYHVPYPHAAPYFIGIVVGYFLAVKSNAFRISKMVQILGWCAAIVCSISSVYGVWQWNKGRVPNIWESALYSGCHRAAWALGLAWVVICCGTGHGGIAHYVLTWKAWVPISRLTYAVYLLHPIVQMLILGNARMKLQPRHDFAVWIFFGHLMVSYGTALGFSMLVEAPCLAIERIILEKRKVLDAGSSGKPQMNGTALRNNHTKESTEDTRTNICNVAQSSEVCRL